MKLAYHVSVKCKQATPANIHTEVACSLLNKCEDTSKVSLSHWNTLFYDILAADYCICRLERVAKREKHFAQNQYNKPSHPTPTLSTSPQYSVLVQCTLFCSWQWKAPENVITSITESMSWQSEDESQRLHCEGTVQIHIPWGANKPQIGGFSSSSRLPWSYWQQRQALVVWCGNACLHQRCPRILMQRAMLSLALHFMIIIIIFTTIHLVDWKKKKWLDDKDGGAKFLLANQNSLFTCHIHQNGFRFPTSKKEKKGTK